MPTSTTPSDALVHAWDRTAITLLGGVGCALSYDALQQMAVAIHVRGLLTYLFPIVIDGFIAYGVRALLVLRTAPFTARAYAWALFAAATAASIWSNALHAIRINQQTPHLGSGLRLGDTTVGVLSTVAPLALAGAVHLYTLIARHSAGDHWTSVQDTEPPPTHTVPQRSTALGADQPADTFAARRRVGGESGRHEAAREIAVDEVAEVAADVADCPQEPAKPKGRQPSAGMDELLAMGRNARRGRDGRISRRNVETAIRAKGHTVGRDRLTEATRRLQAELDKAPVSTS